MKPTRQLKGGKKRAKKPAQVPKGIPVLGRATVGEPHKFKSIPQRPANVPSKAPAVAEATRKLLTIEDDRRVTSEILKAATARPAASERNEEPLMPWPLQLKRLNKQSGDSHLMRRHELDCAAAWLFNFMADERRLYGGDELTDDRYGVLSFARVARDSVLRSIEAFDKRAMVETDGKYRPTFTVEELRNGKVYSGE